MKKIIKDINETWIFCEIMRLIRYRLDQGNIALIDYINNSNKFQILDRTLVLEDDESNKQIEKSKGEEKEKEQIDLISLGEFVKKYLGILSELIDNKQSNILLDFAKRSLFLSTLTKIDSIDISKEKRKSAEEYKEEKNSNNCNSNDDEGYSKSSDDNKKKENSYNLSSSFSLDYLDKDQQVKIEQHLKDGKILKCHHDNCFEAKFSTLREYNEHCHKKHPEQPLHPELSLIEMLKLKKKGNPWEI
jgi:hypothetical protein